jgi:hypothetical protein
MADEVKIRQNRTIAISIKEVTFFGEVKGGAKYICLSQDDQLIKVEKRYVASLANALMSFLDKGEATDGNN